MVAVPPSPGIKFSQFAQGGMPIVGDQAAGLRNGVDTLFDIGSSGLPSGLFLPVMQVAHGFTVGKILRLNGGAFVLAQGDNAADAEVFGIVSAVEDANNFIIQFGGIVTALPAPVSPLVPGTVYFLNTLVPGDLQSIAPSVPGLIVKPILIAYTSNSGLWLNYIGQQL